MLSDNVSVRLRHKLKVFFLGCFEIIASIANNLLQCRRFRQTVSFKKKKNKLFIQTHVSASAAAKGKVWDS